MGPSFDKEWGQIKENNDQKRAHMEKFSYFFKENEASRGQESVQNGSYEVMCLFRSRIEPKKSKQGAKQYLKETEAFLDREWGQRRADQGRK